MSLLETESKLLVSLESCNNKWEDKEHLVKVIEEFKRATLELWAFNLSLTTKERLSHNPLHSPPSLKRMKRRL